MLGYAKLTNRCNLATPNFLNTKPALFPDVDSTTRHSEDEDRSECGDWHQKSVQ